MAKGCGNNSVECWYYGKGNITTVDITTLYNTGTAGQSGNTITGNNSTNWTSVLIGNTLDFVDDNGDVEFEAGKITAVGGIHQLTVQTSQTLSGGRDYTIKDRGQYPVGDDINLTLTHIGVGRGAAFKVWLRPKAGSSPLVTELDRIDVLTGGLNYGTRRRTDTSGASNVILTDQPPIPILGGSATGGSSLRHGQVEVSLSTVHAWHQAKTFLEPPNAGLNAVADVEIEYAFNQTQRARVSLLNKSPNISSLFSDADTSGQYTDFFREGQEIILRDHTTHIILFRGTIQEMEDSWEMGGGPSIMLHLTDHLRELEDIPAEVLNVNRTSAAVQLPSAKIYSIVDEHTRTLKNFKGSERRLAFVEGPSYRVGSGAAAPINSLGQEGLVATKRGHGHQVGRRYAFENSWFPRDTAHFPTAGANGEPVKNERSTVKQTQFSKGKLKVATLLKNLAAQERQGGYVDGGATDHIEIQSGDEWSFHVSPNILTPTPEKLTGTSTDGDNDTWITTNARIGTTAPALPALIGGNILNGDMESSTLLWRGVNESGVVARDTAQVHGGTYSMVVDAINSGYTLISAPFTSYSGQWYRFNAYFYPLYENAGWPITAVTLEIRGGDGSLVKSLTHTIAYSERDTWIQITFDYQDTGLTGGNYPTMGDLRFIATNPAGHNSRMWVDDVTLLPLIPNGVNFVTLAEADASNGRGFFPSDIGKTFTMAGTSRTILGVGQDFYGNPNARLELSATGGDILWTDAAAFSISDALPSIPQFNYFEVGSRPAFAFDSTKGEIADAQSHSVTMILPTQPVEEQGIAKLRATTAEQSSQSIMQPSLEGTEHGTVITDIGGSYGIKNVLTWEVRLKTGAVIEYKYGTIGTNMDNVAFDSANDITLIANTPHALAYGVRITFENATGHTVGTIYRFTSYPQFDNTRALRIMNTEASWSKLNHEKYSTAIVYYNAEVSAEENAGTSNQIRMDLIYGWNVQNRSWVWHDSVNSESGDDLYRVRVHQGDTQTAHSSLPSYSVETGEERERCINFENVNTPHTSYNDLGQGGNAFFAPSWNVPFITLSWLKAEWSDTEEIDGVVIYKFRDFMYRGKDLAEGAWNFANVGDFKSSRGHSAAEFVDVYRGRYSKTAIDSGGNAKIQVEWRRWESGERVAAIQYVDKPAPYNTSQAADSYVHKTSGGGEDIFPFGPGKDEQKMVRALVSFDTGTNENNWPISNTYDDTGRPQGDTSNWVDFPYVRLVGQTTGTKIDFDADIATRPDAPSWTGRPMDTWGVLMPLRRTYTRDNSVDEIRKDISSQLHRRVSDTRAGKFTINKAPYYWIDAQVDGFKESGSNKYGDDDIDPTGESPTSTNPNLTKTIRFKMQKLGATDGLIYYNPLQYGLMIGNVVRFYNHNTGTNGDADSQDYHDSEEFCYGIITDIESITTTPGTANTTREDTFDMCGWIEVQLTHTARKTETTTNGIRFRRVVAAATTGNTGYNEDLLNPGVATGTIGTTDAFDFKGPTRIRVYNMLYPGYTIRVEDRMNDIFAKHLIEGMVFMSGIGGITTEFQTHGNKADQGINKWGTTPRQLIAPVVSIIGEALTTMNANSATGVGNAALNPDGETSSGVDFWFGKVGVTPAPISDYDVSETFIP